jgi:fumarate reductase subunit C
MHLFTNNLFFRCAPRAMKIIIKMTRNEKYMNKCSIIDLCLMVGVSILTSLEGQIYIVGGMMSRIFHHGI